MFGTRRAIENLTKALEQERVQRHALEAKVAWLQKQFPPTYTFTEITDADVRKHREQSLAYRMFGTGPRHDYDVVGWYAIENYLGTRKRSIPYPSRECAMAAVEQQIVVWQ